MQYNKYAIYMFVKNGKYKLKNRHPMRYNSKYKRSKTMALPTSKNPLITKWIDIFNILQGRTEVDNNDILYIAKSTGFTVDAIYRMLGVVEDDPDTANSIFKNNINDFTQYGPILKRRSDDPTKYEVNPAYNHGLDVYFNGVPVHIGTTAINLSGVVKATYEGDGLVKVRVGENMDSSGWNTKDGNGSDATVPDVVTTLGRVPGTSSASFKMGDWDIGLYKPFTTASSITFTSFKLIKTKDLTLKDHKIYRDSTGAVIVSPTDENISSYYEYDGFVHLKGPEDGADVKNVWTISVYGPDYVPGTTTEPLRKATITDIVRIDYSAEITPAETITGSGKFNGSSTGSLVYEIGSDGISTNVKSPMEVEFNYPNSVGARIIREFTINLEAIKPAGDRITVVIELNGNTKEQTLFYLQSEKPVVSATTSTATLAVDNATQENQRCVYYSGVKYYGSGATFRCRTTGGAIKHLNNQMGVGSGSKLTLTDTTKRDSSSVALFVASDISAVPTGTFSAPLVGYGTDFNNACDYDKSGIKVSANKYATAPAIKLTPINAYSESPIGSKTPYEIVCEDCLVNTYSNSSTDLVENFTSEYYRRISSSVGTLWGDTQKQTSLATAGNADLQVIPGVGLVYPSKNYSGFIPSSLAYNTCTGERSFVRKFVKSGSLPGGTLEFTHNVSIQAGLESGNMRIYASKNGSTWYDISFKTVSGGTTLGTAASTYAATISNIVFLWNDGDANNEFYVKITMKQGFTPIITKITLK